MIGVLAAALRLRVAIAKAQPRHPAGAPEGKGGQFAPSRGASAGRPSGRRAGKTSPPPERPASLAAAKGARGITKRDKKFNGTPSALIQSLDKLITGAFGDGEFLGDNGLLNFHGENGTSFIATFLEGKNGPYVHWDEIKLPDDARGKNFRQFVGEMFDLYRKDGQDAVLMAAGYDVGPYVWARAGVLPFPEDWEKVRTNLRPRVDDLPLDQKQRADLYAILDSDDPESIWRLADAPGGKSLLVNTGDRKRQLEVLWRGYFILNDSDQNARLSKYVGRTT
ncbi:hypothetical protein [Rubellimicrobium sp. CFH 75288]|uniref:hypothetical protein n=1 Tax=Rubellimicrobium sp. CFH 75288 TaxID=2697034 RepID=UPI001411CA3F|nr:hypothetical protein [Rubellimicrobium sp. CFH 75288]NAZ37161.1 hypothetical protein [Rubellimicrobium sp. CFH 75288]